ncbi:uncharacterized protein J3D65DRAFT_625691 [Phyllosticta citribraziliensis]|uniref:Uncharacterized protein n=1 Tax=Phyllosticta citribraziliensis TaxID=989973 RepID=A0ABR1LRZ3_9PEZI
MPVLASIKTEAPSAGAYTQKTTTTTTAVSKTTIPTHHHQPQPQPQQPFRLFDLPAEVRLRIYEHVLLVPHTIDLDPSNTYTLSPRLRLLLASRQLHDEAYRVFYGGNTFRLFPVHGRFFHTRKPLLARLSPRCRAAITSVELRLGPGWNGLPSAWGDVASPLLGLADASAWRSLRIFVECDPAGDDVFAGFRRSDDFFTRFCGDLLADLFPRVPSIRSVVFDGFPGVAKDSPLMVELIRVARAEGKRIAWGPERGWANENVVKELEASIASLRLWAGRFASMGH